MLLLLLLVALSVGKPAHAGDFAAAEYHGKAFCPKGSSFSVRNGGECWRCPPGTSRTLSPISGDRACKRESYKLHRKAAKVNKSKTACKKAGMYWSRGECRSCGGYERSLRGLVNINSDKACVRKVAATYYRATFLQDFGCGKDLYFSVKHFGQCYACPESHMFRTINKLTGPKACTNSFKNVFAVDTSGLCRSVVSAIRDGSKGMEKLQGEMSALTQPITKPIAKLLDKTAPDIKSPKALKKFLQKLQLDDPRYRPVLDEVARIGALNRNPDKFAKVILNPDLVCSGDARRINKALLAAGLRRNPVAGLGALQEGRFIHASANAGDDRTWFHVVTASGSLKTKASPFAFAPTLSIVTDLGSRFHLFLSLGAEVTTSLDSGVSIGYLAFPKASPDDFERINQLGLELEVGFKQIQEVVSRNKSPLSRLECIKDRADGIDNQRDKCDWDGDVTFNVSFDPAIFKDPSGNIPGFGLTWNPHHDKGVIKPVGEGHEAAFSADWSFKL